MKGIPMMPNIKQKNLPLKVTVAKFPYPENLFKIDLFLYNSNCYAPMVVRIVRAKKQLWM